MQKVKEKKEPKQTIGKKNVRRNVKRNWKDIVALRFGWAGRRKVRRQIKDRLFRFLIYLAEEYQKLVERAEASIYGTKQVILPAPQCIVFYNGEKAMPEEQILCLSDAFEKQKNRSDVELKVRMLNINYGNNPELMEKCRVLKEYAEFVETVRKYVKEGKNRQEALNMVIDYCIDHDILSEFLKSYRAEVLGMLLEEFDVDKYERTIKAEGREEGREEILELTRKLIEQNRMDDLKRLAEDSAYREKLFREFGL